MSLRPSVSNIYRKRWLLRIVAAIFCTVSAVSSCRTAGMSSADIGALARAGLLLGFDIDKDDDHRLYLEAAQWIGVPYRATGTTRAGVDCSGLTCGIYRNAYARQLSRNSGEQYSKDCITTVSRRSLRPGDLVFFSSPDAGEKISHVGIYLKEGKFIHASSSRGVVVDNIDAAYWSRTLVSCGRPRK